LKSKTLLFAAAIAGLFLARAESETINVFLIGGQSNADGRATVSGLPSNLQTPQNDVPFYYGISNSRATAIRKSEFTTLRPGLSNTSQFGPEVTFGRSMADYYAAKGGSIALIKYANGGTNLAVDWHAGGTATTTGDGAIYQNFQSIVTSGLAALQAANPEATLQIAGMIWMQGESDSNVLSAQYQTNLTAFINDIRLTYGADLPFVIGQLSTNQTGTNADAGGTTQNRNTVRAAQAAVASTLPHAALVTSGTFGLNADNLHFSAAGQQALGNAFATQMQSLVAVPEPSTTSMAASALLLCALVGRFRQRG
jgi:lysophospholipase L1-like esterase